MSYRLIGLGVLATALIIAMMLGCDKQQDHNEPVAESPEYTDSLVIELTGVDGESVLAITGESYSVEYTESAMGAFVTAIDSVENGDGYWWLFMVNDSAAQIACDKYITASGDKITWSFRKQ